MTAKIRKMKEQDREEVKEMMQVFYHSPAVFTNGSEKIYNNDITACVGESHIGSAPAYFSIRSASVLS